MNVFDKVSDGKKLLIGMVHCLPLPGTYSAAHTIQEVAARAVSDAKCLAQCGYDAIIIENEDLCTTPRMTNMQFSAISMVAYAVRQAVDIPIGLCFGCLNYEQALSAAKLIGADFIRCPIFVDTVMNYNGIISPCSAQVVAYRQQIGADNVKILADIQVKHYLMVNPNVDICVSASWAVHQGADAVIVTGSATGVEASGSDLRKVRGAVKIPVVVGSGVTDSNIRAQLSIADAVIIGTGLRQGGRLENPVDSEKAAQIVRAARGEITE